MRTLVRAALAAVALAAAAALSACSGASGASDAPADSGYGGAVSVPKPGPAAGTGGGEADPAATPTDRSIVTTGSVSVLVTDVAKAAEAAAGIATQAGGRVDARQEQAPTASDRGSATLTLRIPAAALDAALDSLKGLGTPQTVSLSSNDVTTQVNDLDAQINALQTAITRLTSLMGQATSTDDLIAMEDAITTRQGQLDSLRSQQRALQDQVAMSTITVSLVTEPIVTKPAPVTFVDGLLAGWEGLGAFAAGLLVVLGAILPWLIPLAIVGGIVWLVVWITRRRRRAPAPSAPAAS